MRKFGSLPDVDEFENKGFVIKSSNMYILHRLRKQYGEYMKIFDVGHRTKAGGSEAKFGTYELFGSKLCYYYDERRKEDFVNFLVEKFYENNPDPERDIRKVFTRILHLHNLHWKGCYHG